RRRMKASIADKNNFQVIAIRLPKSEGSMRHECFFSTASQQSYGIRRDFPEMSPAKAALTLQGELSSAIRKAVAFHECHEKGETPPRLVVRAPASLGKSSAILGELKRLFDDPETAKLRI